MSRRFDRRTWLQRSAAVGGWLSAWACCAAAQACCEPPQAPDPTAARIEDPQPRTADPEPDRGRHDNPQSAIRTPQASNPKPQAAVHVNLADRVEMHVTDLPIGEVLRMLSEESRRNIIASKNVSGTVTANLYDVTFDEALAAILRMNGLGYVRRGDFVFVHTAEELAALRQAERKPVTRVFRLKFLTAADAKTLIAPLLSQAGRLSVTPPASVGLDDASGSGAGTGGNSHSSVDTLIVSDDPERIEQIAQVLAELDARPPQVLIEATILRATLNEDNALGIDFTTVGGVDFQAVGSTSPAAQSVTTGALPTQRLEDTTFTVRSEFNGNVPGGGLTLGIIKNQVGVFLRALEQVADTTVLANPKVLTLNKQRGSVIVGRRDGYLTTTVTETAAIQTVEFLETGTQLYFRPFILDDQYIRMEIHPEDSTGGLTPANLPFEQTTEVTSNILIRDGHTILIGGLFREVTTSGRSQIPGLGNLPLVGALFRFSNDSTVREEVIILLTVHIVQAEPLEREGRDLSESVERYRLGIRRGLQAHGRERMAQAHYHWALEHLADGRLSRALWDARLAVQIEPRFLPALELLERLRGRRLWDEEGSAVRHHIQRLLSEQHGITLPPYGRPAPPFVIPDDLRGAAGFDPGPPLESKVEESKVEKTTTSHVQEGPP